MHVNFSTGASDASGKFRKQTAGMASGWQTSHGLKLYQTDNRDNRDITVKRLQFDNPASKGMEDTGGYDESGHLYPFVNVFKTCDMLIGHMKTPSASTNDPGSIYLYKLNNGNWGNWRNYGSETGAQIVPDNVLLFPEGQVLDFSFKHEYESAFSSLKEKGMVNKLENTMEVARLGMNIINDARGQSAATTLPAGGKFMSRFKEIPAWKGVSAFSIPSQIKFNFNFGDAGLYSGEYEVVRPIIALVSHFTVKQAEGQPNYFSGPAPTAPAYMMSMIASLGKAVQEQAPGAAGGLAGQVSDITGAFSSGNSGGDGSSGGIANGVQNAATEVVEKATELQNAIYGAIDAAIGNSLSQIKIFMLRYGRAVCGPFMCENIQYSFDMSEVDEFGYPTKGNVTFSNPRGIFLPTNAVATTMFDQNAN